MINSNKIKGRMREMEITQADVAKFLKIAPPTANQKINGIRPFSLEEAKILANKLNIKPQDFDSYFFIQ